MTNEKDGETHILRRSQLPDSNSNNRNDRNGR